MTARDQTAMDKQASLAAILAALGGGAAGGYGGGKGVIALIKQLITRGTQGVLKPNAGLAMMLPGAVGATAAGAVGGAGLGALGGYGGAKGIEALLGKESMDKQASIAAILALLGGGAAGGYGGAKGIAALIRKFGKKTLNSASAGYMPNTPPAMRDLLQKSLGGIPGGPAALAGGAVGGGLGGIGAQALMEAINGNGRLG